MKHCRAALAKLFALLALTTWALAQGPESELVARARNLVDIYYGDKEILREAAGLLGRAHQADPKDANVYVQAARITAMGGFIEFDRFEAGTFQRYAALLDKALALDPSNAKAHILKAEVFEREGRRAEQRSELDKAKDLVTMDPWLDIGYGRYFMAMGDTAASNGAYNRVIRDGPGSSPSGRKAYVAAVKASCKFQRPNEAYEDTLRRNAALAMGARYPTDAWTPHWFAETFIDWKLFDDAISHAREALKTMDFIAGRKTLAAALYARAAELRLANRPVAEIDPLRAEARSLGFEKSSLLEYLLVERGIGDKTKSLGPVLRELIP
jgi:tetratricopeptide (TPR) repeat protein